MGGVSVPELTKTSWLGTYRFEIGTKIGGDILCAECLMTGACSTPTMLQFKVLYIPVKIEIEHLF